MRVKFIRNDIFVVPKRRDQQRGQRLNDKTSGYQNVTLLCAEWKGKQIIRFGFFSRNLCAILNVFIGQRHKQFGVATDSFILRHSATHPVVLSFVVLHFAVLLFALVRSMRLVVMEVVSLFRVWSRSMQFANVAICLVVLCISVPMASRNSCFVMHYVVLHPAVLQSAVLHFAFLFS